MDATVRADIGRQPIPGIIIPEKHELLVAVAESRETAGKTYDELFDTSGFTVPRCTGIDNHSERNNQATSLPSRDDCGADSIQIRLGQRAIGRQVQSRRSQRFRHRQLTVLH